MQETRVQSLGQGDPLEMRTATHSSILAWRISCTERHSFLSSLRNRAAAAAAAKSLQSCPTLCDPIDGSQPVSPSLEFSRQEHWSGLPFPSPGDLPDPGIEPVSPALAGRYFTTVPPEKPNVLQSTKYERKNALPAT